MSQQLKVAAVLVCVLLGCKEQREDAQQTANAAKAVMELTKGANNAMAAAAEAERTALAQIPAGTDPALAKQQVELAKGIATMKAMAGGGGPVVNWRQLVPFLPDEVAGFVAPKPAEGSTKKMGGFEVTKVERRYEAGDVRVNIDITDAFTSPLMRAPFAMAAMIEEDSSRGYKKGKKLGGHTAIVAWTETVKRSTVDVLVAERFLVEVRVRKALKPDHAETVAQALKLDDLAKVKPEAPDAPDAQPAAPAATP